MGKRKRKRVGVSARMPGPSPPPSEEYIEFKKKFGLKWDKCKGRRRGGCKQIGNKRKFVSRKAYIQGEWIARQTKKTQEHKDRTNATRRDLRTNDPVYRAIATEQGRRCRQNTVDSLRWCCKEQGCKSFGRAFSTRTGLKTHEHIYHPTDISSITPGQAYRYNVFKVQRKTKLPKLSGPLTLTPQMIKDCEEFFGKADLHNTVVDPVKYTFYVCIGIKLEKEEEDTPPSEIPSLIMRDPNNPRPYSIYVGSVNGDNPFCPQMNKTYGHLRGSLVKMWEDELTVFAIYKKTFDVGTPAEVCLYATAMEGAIQCILSLRKEVEKDGTEFETMVNQQIQMKYLYQLEEMEKQIHKHKLANQCSLWKLMLWKLAHFPSDRPILKLLCPESEIQAPECGECLCTIFHKFCVVNLKVNPLKIIRVPFAEEEEAQDDNYDDDDEDYVP